MKHEKRISCLIAAVLAFCISFGCAAGIITGFSLNVTDGSVAVDFYTEPADLLTVMAFCAVFSVVAAIAFSFRWGGLVLMGILAFLLGYLWRIDVLEESVEAILYRLTYIYHQAYHCGIATWTDAYSPEVSPNLGLCIFAGIAVLVTAWTVCRRKSAIPAAIYSCALLGLCLVVTDTVPAAWCLFLLLVSLVLLILTNTVRRQNALDGNRLTALMLVPVLLFVSVLFWAVPSAGYESKVTDFQKLLAEWFQGQSSGDLIDSGFTGTALGAVNLSTVGPKIERYYPVMDVIAAEATVVLLADVRRLLHSCSNACDFHNQMIMNLLKIMAGKNLAFHQKIEITSKRTTRDKLMTFLLLEAKKQGSSSFTIPYDRQELADYLEVDRSGLSAEISKLCKEGLIESKRSWFKVL